MESPSSVDSAANTETSRPLLFTPLKIADTTFKNRIFVSPMCQYSAQNGLPDDWHLVHLGSRAVGGAALVICEATAVNAIGRISPGDLGIWNDEQVHAFRRITNFIRQNGSVAGIQLAHAGRKGSTDVPWLGSGRVPAERGGWTPVAPSPVPFTAHDPEPRELSSLELDDLIQDFVRATKRSLEAGFQVIELHMAHGYLLHEFLSPISNQRADQYGGSLENRMRFPLAVARAVRDVWPKELPLFVRISATDWSTNENGWDLDSSIRFSQELRDIGIDFIDCSTGGTLEHPKIPVGLGYQVPFAAAIRKTAEIKTGAVGVIVSGKQAEAILREGHADAVLLAREFLRDPYFPLHAAKEMGFDVKWPVQYERAKR